MQSGIKNQLDVLLGHANKIATIFIAENSESDISLVYEPHWVEQGFAISPHLPLSGHFSQNAVRNYLQNLLPEGRGLEEITSNTHISKNNTFGLIRIIGSETSGALSFKPTGMSLPETHFREIGQQELATKLLGFKTLGESITYWDGRTRLSVAGVQDKLNLLEFDNKLGFGEGKLCSNKIFKFETGKVPFIAVNEFFTMLLAKAVGLIVPDVELRAIADVRVFVIDRFDRRLVANENRVLRRHVIDGCQACNLPPSYKYERQFGDDGDSIYFRDGVSFSKLFAVTTANASAYQTQLIRWMTFNILVRNYDAHGKNISFFVGKNGLELTPFYDLVNIEAIIQSLPSVEFGRSYAMSVGEHTSGAGNFTNPITAYMLADFADEFAISIARLQLVMQQIVNATLACLEQTKQQVLAFELTPDEVQHIDLCIAVIKQSAIELQAEINQLPSLQDLF